VWSVVLMYVTMCHKIIRFKNVNCTVQKLALYGAITCSVRCNNVQYTVQ